MNLEEWNELGFDRNSVIANPGFTDPENGDFTLKPDSPVKEIGFIEFELDKFGLEKEYKNKYRKN